MKKPELLVTPTSTADILPLIQAGATAFLVGEQRYGLRLAGEFSREDITKAVEIAHKEGAKVYVAVNAIFHNDKVGELGEYLAFLAEAAVDAAVFGDPAVLMAARESAPDLKLHWSTETTGDQLLYMQLLGTQGCGAFCACQRIKHGQHC